MIADGGAIARARARAAGAAAPPPPTDPMQEGGSAISRARVRAQSGGDQLTDPRGLDGLAEQQGNIATPRRWACRW